MYRRNEYGVIWEGLLWHGRRENVPAIHNLTGRSVRKGWKKGESFVINLEI